MVYAIVLIHFNANNFMYGKGFFPLCLSLSQLCMTESHHIYLFIGCNDNALKKTIPTIFANEFRGFS